MGADDGVMGVFEIIAGREMVMKSGEEREIL